MLVRSQDKGYNFGRQYPNQCACKGDSKTDKTISRKKRTGFHKVEWQTLAIKWLVKTVYANLNNSG